jgi:hypothetical protein
MSQARRVHGRRGRAGDWRKEVRARLAEPGLVVLLVACMPQRTFQDFCLSITVYIGSLI